MKKKTTMIAVRHGETEWNKEKRYQGHLDSSLTERGLAQARAVADALAEPSPLWSDCFAALYSSDLGRAVQTAECIGKRLNLAVNTDARLREINLGIIQGLRAVDIAEKHPEVYRQCDDWQYAPPGAETRQQRYDRSIASMLEMFGKHEGETFVVVTHGGVLDGFLRQALRIPISDPRRFSIFNGSLNVISRQDDDLRLESWGIVHHLTNASVLDGEKI